MHFSLDDYFETTRKYYYFFDGLLNDCMDSKKSILNQLGISESSYRSERLKLYVKNENRKILLNYFNYQDIQVQDKLKYEKCLARIYYCAYFKDLNELKLLLKEIDTYIAQNNYLKPVFVLFRVFIVLNLEYSMSKMKFILIKDLEYLALFKKNYFEAEYEIIYQCILYFFEVTKSSLELERIANRYPKLLWLYYHVKASYHYLHCKDIEALIYYEAALKEYYKFYNVERTIQVSSNIAYIYNLLEKYVLSIEVSKKIVEYVYSSKCEKWINYIVQHYLYSHFMMENYEAIIEFYQIVAFNVKSLNSVSAVICILASFLKNKLDLASEILKVFQEDFIVTHLYHFMTDEDESFTHFQQFFNKPYIVRIVEKLKKIKMSHFMKKAR